MKLINALILHRVDLTLENANENINSITYEMFSHMRNGILFYEELALFVDDNGSIKIIKDDFGLLNVPKQ